MTYRSTRATLGGLLLLAMAGAGQPAAAEAPNYAEARDKLTGLATSECQARADAYEAEHQVERESGHSIARDIYWRNYAGCASSSLKAADLVVDWAETGRASREKVRRCIAAVGEPRVFTFTDLTTVQKIWDCVR